jgi:hypothetical protein
VLTWVAIAALAGTLLLAGRWVLAPRDSLGRSISFPIVSVTLLAVVGTGALVPVVLHQRLEGRLSSVASSEVGAPVAVHCQSIGQEMVDVGSELGYVRYGPDGVPEHATLIKHPQCGDLSAYLHSDKTAPSLDQVIAVHVLTHESQHMAGQTSEARAECQAVQRDAQTAQLLGATADQARALARRYWTEVYPRMGDDYRSADCAPGGPLDEHLPDAPWSVPDLGMTAEGAA